MSFFILFGGEDLNFVRGGYSARKKDSLVKGNVATRQKACALQGQDERLFDL